MMVQLAALGIQPPQINALGAFQQGATSALGIQQAQQGMKQSAETHQSNMQNAELARQNAKREQALKSMEIIGSVAMGAMDGKMDGQVDPQKYEQGLDMLEGYGVDVSKFRGKPELAPVVAKSSLTAMQQISTTQEAQKIDLAMKKFELDVMQAAQKANAGPGASSPLGKLAEDFRSGLITKDQYDAAVKKATQSSGGITVSPDGTIQIGGSGKPATEGQAKANIYASRAENSNTILDQLESQGTSLKNKSASGIPVFGNYMVSEDYQQYEQAQRDFINAILRQESGAVIAEEEFKNAEKQYFPQPGDSEKTIEQKRANRETAIKAIRQASGPFAITGSGAPQQNDTPQQPQGGQPPEITSKQEYDALPSGSQFVWQGKVGIKP